MTRSTFTLARGLHGLAWCCVVLPLPLMFGRFSPSSLPGRWQPWAWLVFLAGLLLWLVSAWLRPRPVAARPSPVEPAVQAPSPLLKGHALASDEADPDRPGPDADADVSSDAANELPREPDLTDSVPPEGPWGPAFWQTIDGPRLQALAAEVLADAAQPLRVLARPDQTDLGLQTPDDPEGAIVGVLRCHLAEGDEVVRIDKLRPLLAVAQRQGLAHLVFATTARVGSGARAFASKHAITLLDPLALSDWLAQSPPERVAAWRAPAGDAN